MKSMFILSVVLVVTYSIYGQPFGNAAINYRIVKMNYENSIGERATTSFVYNYDGNLTKAFWSLNDKRKYSTNFYEHDNHGNLVSAYREFSDSLTSFELFIYDSIGNKLSEEFYRSDGKLGFATYTYQNNQLTQASLKNYKGWLNGTLTYKYNKHNIREKGTLQIDDKIVCQIDYTYDHAGNLRKEFWNFNDKWNQTFHYIYERENLIKNYYSSPFLSCAGEYRISKEDYSYNNEIGGPSNYIYNDQGLLVEKVFQRSDSIFTNTYYKYDEDGKLISSHRKYSNGDFAKFTYTYDENNNLISRFYYKADTLYGYESYLYNTNGELKQAYFKNFDNWLTGSISFKVNSLGVITSGDFKGKDGFDAYIVFIYNDIGLVSEIKWNFSFGKSQQYIFKYTEIDSP